MYSRTCKCAGRRDSYLDTDGEKTIRVCVDCDKEIHETEAERQTRYARQEAWEIAVECRGCGTPGCVGGCGCLDKEELAHQASLSEGRDEEFDPFTDVPQPDYHWETPDRCPSCNNTPCCHGTTPEECDAMIDAAMIRADQRFHGPVGA